MTTLTMRSLFAVAALAVAAVSASAQTYKAQVPVSFEVSGKTLVAGAYTFGITTTANGQPLVTVRNDATHRAAVLMANPGADVPKAWKDGGSPIISFACLGDRCALDRLWTARGSSTYAFPGLKVKAAETERLASITVTLVKGD